MKKIVAGVAIAASTCDFHGFQQAVPVYNGPASQFLRDFLACPYFFPTVRHDAELWPHRRRLPLGDGFAGHCTAPGHEDVTPSDQELGQCCNLGYASSCPHLPQDRAADAVHFSVGGDREGVVQVCWVMVKDHAHAANGTLEFARSAGWRVQHPEPALQQMAECYLNSYFAKKGEARRAPSK